MLHLLAATPSNSPLTNYLIPPGTPIAHLERLHVDLSWYKSESSRSNEGETQEEDHGAAETVDDIDDVLLESDTESHGLDGTMAEHEELFLDNVKTRGTGTRAPYCVSD
jgi:hypothetical protein